MTQVNIRAEQMREMASRNPTTHGLLLYLSLFANNANELVIPSIREELSTRGVDVNETQLYDAFQDLEDLGLGSIIYGKKGSGSDVFKTDYDLSRYVKRAFTGAYLHEWEDKLTRGNVFKLVDPKFKFQETREEKKKAYKENSGKRGRPKGYSLKLGRYFTPQEMAEREARKANPRPRGRPEGWRKYPEEIRAKLAARNKETAGKRGRPKGYSHKLGRFMTAAELAAKTAPKGKRGRPFGWRKNPEQVSVARRPSAPKAPVMRAKGSVDMRVLNIPLRNNRHIHIELPYNLSQDEAALLTLNLDHIIKSA